MTHPDNAPRLQIVDVGANHQPEITPVCIHKYLISGQLTNRKAAGFPKTHLWGSKLHGHSSGAGAPRHMAPVSGCVEPDGAAAEVKVNHKQLLKSQHETVNLKDTTAARAKPWVTII